jgi:hypothetical protein
LANKGVAGAMTSASKKRIICNSLGSSFGTLPDKPAHAGAYYAIAGMSLVAFVLSLFAPVGDSSQLPEAAQ